MGLSKGSESTRLGTPGNHVPRLLKYHPSVNSTEGYRPEIYGLPSNPSILKCSATVKSRNIILQTTGKRTIPDKLYTQDVNGIISYDYVHTRNTR